jgi:hypothetical protein
MLSMINQNTFSLTHLYYLYYFEGQGHNYMCACRLFEAKSKNEAQMVVPMQKRQSKYPKKVENQEFCILY